MLFMFQISDIDVENLKFTLKAIGLVLLIFILAYILLTSKKE